MAVLTRQGHIQNLVNGELSRAEVVMQIRRSKEAIQHAQQQVAEHRMVVSYLNNAIKMICPSHLPTALEVSDLAKQLLDGTKTWEQIMDEFDKRNLLP